MSRVRIGSIGGAGGRRSVRQCRMQQRTSLVFRMCLESGGDGRRTELFVTRDREFQTAGATMPMGIGVSAGCRTVDGQQQINASTSFGTRQLELIPYRCSSCCSC